MADVFISYARADRNTVKPLAVALESRGYSVWWDHMLPGGSRFRSAILEQLNLARAVLVLWSRHSVTSHFVEDEAERARQANKLVPILTNDFDVALIPLGFGGYHAARIDEFHRIVAALEALNMVGIGAPDLDPAASKSVEQLPSGRSSLSDTEQRLIRECLEEANAAERAFMRKLAKLKEEIERLQSGLRPIDTGQLDLMRSRLRHDAFGSSTELREKRSEVNSAFVRLQAFIMNYNVPHEARTELSQFVFRSACTVGGGALAGTFFGQFRYGGLIYGFAETLGVMFVDFLFGAFAGAWLLRYARHAALKHRVWSIAALVGVIAVTVVFNVLAGHALTDTQADGIPTLLQAIRLLDFSLPSVGFLGLGLSVFFFAMYSSFTMWGAYPGYRSSYKAWVASRNDFDRVVEHVHERLDAGLQRNLSELETLGAGNRERSVVLSKMAGALELESSAIEDAFAGIKKACRTTIERYRSTFNDRESVLTASPELQLSLSDGHLDRLRKEIRAARYRIDEMEQGIALGKQALESEYLALAAALRNDFANMERNQS